MIDSRTRANALRSLAIDAVEQAKSGHPGAPLGMADMVEVLWHKYLRHDPNDPHWPDRDRFVLSNGHASALLYALLHLTGYDLPLQELRRFRQLHSRTPGHPETGLTPGVETTTGPLGQGLANAVGMALAEKTLAAQFNREGHAIVDHRTFVVVGDGCLMEGVSHEAASLAGTLKLDKLIVLYDDNGISIDGEVEGWFTDDTVARFRAYGWTVPPRIDGHDARAVDMAITAACRDADAGSGRPTLIVCRTVIGWGSPNRQGTHEVHGAPLGAEEAAATRATLGWNHAPFDIPAQVRQSWDARERGAKLHADWQARFEAYAREHPQLAEALLERLAGQLPAGFESICLAAARTAASASVALATRKASQQVLDAVAPVLPALFGGSADLTGSNLTNFKGCSSRNQTADGNYLSFGVREFGMAAVMNGIALHGGFITYGGTFLTFSDYSRNAIRMAALMKLKVIHVFTHDSIGLGEDGPTHQAIEHGPSLRLIPNLDVWRPADLLETWAAWRSAIEREDGPSALLLSRQNLVPPDAPQRRMSEVLAGGYVLEERKGAVATLVATGSEVSLAIAAARELEFDGIGVRIVSMPCTQRFDMQDEAYRERVVPRGLPVIAIEAAHPDGWYKYTGRDGLVLGINSFGESAPAAQLFEHFGLTPLKVAAAVGEFLERRSPTKIPEPAPT
jgi:transketolase